MTSEKSFSVSLQSKSLTAEYTKRRLAVIALTALYAVAGYVVLPILYLTQRQHQYTYWSGFDPTLYPLSSYMQNGARYLMGFTTILFLGVIALALLSAFQGFYWMYRSQAVDFYESQPIPRRKRFFAMFANSILTYAIISAVGTVISLIIIGATGAMSGAVAAEILIEYVLLLILFFAVYSLSVLAVVLSKNIIIAVAVDAIFLSAEFLITALFSWLRQLYYTTYFDVSDMIEGGRPHIYLTSAIGNYWISMQAIAYEKQSNFPTFAELGETFFMMAPYHIFTLIIGIAVLAIAYFIYERRPAEAIGSGVIYKPFAAALKLVVAIPLAIFTGMAVDSVFDTEHYHLTVIVVFLIAIVAVVACMISEVIDAGNIRALLRRAWQIPVTFAVALFVIIYYKADLSGHDSYVPDADQVEDVALFGDWYFRDYYGEVDAHYVDYYAYQHYVRNMHLSEIDEVRQIADVGMDAQRSWTLFFNTYKQEHEPPYNYSGEEGNIDGWTAYVVYNMKDGSTVGRQILIPRDIDRNLMDAVIGDPDFKETFYQTHITAARAKYFYKKGELSYSAGYGSSSVNISAAQLEELLDCYRKDLEQYDFTYCLTHTPVGSMRYSDSDSDEYVWADYEVYPEYAHTIGWLRGHDIYLEPGLPTEQINSLTLIDSVWGEDGSWVRDRELKVTDAAEIAQIAEHAYNAAVNELYKDIFYPETLEYVTISFTINPDIYISTDYAAGDEYIPPETFESFTIKRSDLPAAVRERLEAATSSDGDMAIYDDIIYNGDTYDSTTYVIID